MMQTSIYVVARIGVASPQLLIASQTYESFANAYLEAWDGGGHLRYALSISGVHVEAFYSSPSSPDEHVVTLSGRLGYVKGKAPALTVKQEHADLIHEARGRARLAGS